ILFMAVWAIWLLGTWVVIYFDAEALSLRFMLVGVMTVSMLMFTSLPHAETKWAFGVALPMVAMLFAWPIFLLSQVGRSDELRLRFLRQLLWAPVLAIPWIAGAVSSASAQVAWWGVAVALIYGSAWLGYPVPRLGRLEPNNWAITGAHLATRCAQMLAIGLGESFIVVSARVGLRPPPPAVLTAWILAFLSIAALWWTHNENLTKLSRAPR